MKNKICYNCKNAGYSQSVIGLANHKDTTPQKMDIIYCYENSVRNFKKKFYTCDLHVEREDSLD